jgi:hypothetical protein
MLLKGPRSHTSSTTLFYWFMMDITRKIVQRASLPYFQKQITSFWLVSYIIEGVLLPIQGFSSSWLVLRMFDYFEYSSRLQH